MFKRILLSLLRIAFLKDISSTDERRLKDTRLAQISTIEICANLQASNLCPSVYSPLVIQRLIILLILACFCIANKSYCKENLIKVATIDNYIINPVVDEYITSSIKKTKDSNAECLIIRLDTPGGLLESTRRIVKNIMNADVPVVVYISPQGSRAGSAGVFITLASHIAAMAPSTNIGAAHPVSIEKKERSLPEAIHEVIEYLKRKEKKDEQEEVSEEEAQEETPEEERTPLEDKILNDTLAWISSIAEQRNRNVEWAKKAVLESVSATEKEALQLNIINFIAEDLEDLKLKLDGLKVETPNKEHTLHTKDARLDFLDLDLRQRILNTIINPNIAYILMILGFYGLLYEITHPGFGFPGIAGTICLIIAFYAFQALPINYAGLALIILAILLFIAEAFTPTFGLFTLGGIISMVLGSLMLINSPYSFMRVSLTVILPIVLATAIITVFLLTMVVRTHRKKVRSGREALIGEIGEAKTNITATSGGKVFVHGEIWTAKSKQSIKKEDKVKVAKIEGLILTVEKVK